MKPIGDCFEVHGRYIMDIPRNQKTMIKLVHGKITGQKHLKGKRFAHAWIEIGNDVVIDISNGRDIIMSKEMYYDLAKVTDEPDKLAKYTMEETCKKLLQETHWGPWDLSCEL